MSGAGRIIDASAHDGYFPTFHAWKVGKYQYPHRTRQSGSIRGLVMTDERARDVLFSKWRTTTAKVDELMASIRTRRAGKPNAPFPMDECETHAMAYVKVCAASLAETLAIVLGEPEDG